MRKMLIGRNLAITSVVGLFACASAQAAVTINEIRVDDGQDIGQNANDYFELAGNLGEALSGLTYVVIGDNSNSATDEGGFVESTITFGSTSIGSDGFYLGIGASNTLGMTNDGAVGFNGFEANDNTTHLLVSGWSGGTDLDTNDDGTLDSMPWTSVLDAVSIVNNATPGSFSYNYYYATALGGANIGPDASDPQGPVHVFRDPDGNGAWHLGLPDLFSPNADDSPGTPNSPVVPEPSSLMLVGISALGLIRRRA
ncbi:MAG TPA: PEP-CTERM sorting domain-containing protein [Tepidisphaeraceae bacterium]|nr:PEP-CTERM sorting domain-containing protein [Tepidisphaeraceae bacterium]